MLNKFPERRISVKDALENHWFPKVEEKTYTEKTENFTRVYRHARRTQTIKDTLQPLEQKDRIFCVDSSLTTLPSTLNTFACSPVNKMKVNSAVK